MLSQSSRHCEVQRLEIPEEAVPSRRRAASSGHLGGPGAAHGGRDGEGRGRRPWLHGARQAGEGDGREELPIRGCLEPPLAPVFCRAKPRQRQPGCNPAAPGGVCAPPAGTLRWAHTATRRPAGSLHEPGRLAFPPGQPGRPPRAAAAAGTAPPSRGGRRGSACAPGGRTTPPPRQQRRRQAKGHWRKAAVLLLRALASASSIPDSPSHFTCRPHWAARSALKPARIGCARAEHEPGTDTREKCFTVPFPCLILSFLTADLGLNLLQ